MTEQSSPLKKIAIIGAGTAGLVLAHSLAQHGIKSVVYESRSEAAQAAGAGVAVLPNGLRLLDRLGLYAPLAARGFSWEATSLVDEDGRVRETFFYGHRALYGYPALRLARRTLAAELTRAVVEGGGEVRYSSRFEGVVEDGDGGVAFKVNGAVERADMLIGADGIHSSVRRTIDPAPLVYGGIVGIACIVPSTELRWPTTDFPRAAMIRGASGVTITVPEDPEMKNATAALQMAYPEQSREGWSALNADKARLAEVVRRGYEGWGDVNRSLIDAMTKHADGLLVWPFYNVPKLKTWASESHRVVLVGDAAHAVPPSSGQGVSQAVEDVYSLAMLLSKLTDISTLGKTIEAWQAWRQARIEQIERVVYVMNIKRMTEEERKTHTDIRDEDLNSVESGERLFASLFETDLHKELEAWEG